MAEEKIEWDTGGEKVQWDDAPKAPKAPTQAPDTGKDPLSEIGYSTALGGITGLAAPEVAETVGRGMERIPYKPVQMAGKAMRAAVPSMTGVGRRAATGVGGAVGGFTGEASGQLAEALGAPAPVAESARIVGGILPLELASQATKGGRAIASLVASKVPGGQIIRSVMEDVGVANLAGKQRELVLKRIQELRNSPFTTDAQKKVYDTLSDAVSKSTSVAEAEARAATAAGERVSREERGAAQRLAGTAAELEEGKKTVIDRAKGALRQVGDATREVSEIGRTLRDRILSRFETGALERSEAYKKQKAIRDAAVAAKENQGVLVESTPEYKELVQDLRNKLLIGSTARKQTTAPVTEPGVLRSYQNIYDAVTARRVQVGVNEMGNPVYKTFPTSFDALDDVRRRLGDAAFGKAAEGYEALGQKIAQEYYAKISNIQSKFAGESHDVLQSEYEIASKLLNKFKTKAGAKATAMDRIDPEQFKSDAKGLPAALFNSQQSVQDAIALTGDRNLIAKEASDYVAKTLANMDAKAAKNWLSSKQNSDWLSALPEVRQAANTYVANLERAESMAGGMAKVGGRVTKRGEQAGKEAERALVEGEKGAAKITEAAQKEANAILGTEEPAARVASIITSGDRTLWDRVAPALASAPKGKETLEAAIRQVMADKATQGVFGAQRFWQTSLSDSLARTGLMDARKIKQIGDQLDTIANSTLSEPQKLDFLNRTLRNIVITYAAPQLGTPVVRSGMDVITGAGNPLSMQPGR
ncbi:hypothetical protein UFOVP687_23 [uncultured Caudovirales phage]|uniref:Uncharacterized protein n=1 Tax=uncultured Caudovirales phage TaxID=2100421 RepID=A0A6J5M8B1_9CAUD|nr:hypothetical protein UFOVP414_33 [uncultured Caudovirales phage]CAB4157756.1 hypothetical protein UFOVP687_23 [uncultured Caudovirales phage]